MVYDDRNVSAARDADESGMGGVTVYLDKNNNRRLDGGEARTTTDAGGHYSFLGLAVGTHRVRVVLPSHIEQVNPPRQGSIVVNLKAGQSSDFDNDFGLTRNGLVSGNVFRDLNRNRKRNTGEPALGGVTVFVDANNNGKADANEASTTTDANGNFNLVVTPGKKLRVRVLPAVQTTEPVGGVFTVDVSLGSRVLGKNFGVR